MEMAPMVRSDVAGIDAELVNLTEGPQNPLDARPADDVQQNGRIQTARTTVDARTTLL